VHKAKKVTSTTGKKIYKSSCATCHRAGSAGAPVLGDVEAWRPLLAQGIHILFDRALKGYGSMPSRGTCTGCSDAELRAAVTYMMQESREKVGAVKKVSKKIKKLTLAQGKQIYQVNCAVCHDKGEIGAPKIGDRSAWQTLLKKNMDVLITNSIRGFKRMPPRGACIHCSDAEIIAAIKYIVHESNVDGDYSLW